MNLIIEIANAVTINPEDIPGTGWVSNGAINWDSLISGFFRLFSSLIFFAAFLSLLYSGFMFISAGGDSSKVEKAKKNMTWAITGIIIATFSFLIVTIVSNVTTGIGDEISEEESSEPEGKEPESAGGGLGSEAEEDEEDI